MQRQKPEAYAMGHIVRVTHTLWTPVMESSTTTILSCRNSKIAASYERLTRQRKLHNLRRWTLCDQRILHGAPRTRLGRCFLLPLKLRLAAGPPELID